MRMTDPTLILAPSSMRTLPRMVPPVPPHPLRPPPAFAALALEGAQSFLEATSVLATIILVHESGHFLAARLQGIHVSKFAIGFHPILARFFANGVEYSLCAFPLVGFVGFPDDDPDSDIPLDNADLLKNRPILNHLLIISAGVAANIAFAYLIVFTQVLTVGLPVQETLPSILVLDVHLGPPPPVMASAPATSSSSSMTPGPLPSRT